MRIALVNEFYPPHASGGADWSTEALAHALAKRGHGVVVMTPRWGEVDVAPAVEEHDGVRVRRFRVPWIQTQPPGPPAVQKVLRPPGDVVVRRSSVLVTKHVCVERNQRVAVGRRRTPGAEASHRMRNDSLDRKSVV